MDMLGRTVDGIGALLDLGAERHRVIATNIANINTPGYKAKELRFDAVLSKAEEKEREGIPAREDGNNVVMEIENGEMRKNALLYRIYLSALSHEVRLARTAITGRS